MTSHEMTSADRSLAPAQDLEVRLRELMTQAPGYQNDTALRGDFMTNYCYGAYPPSELSPGLVITEEVVPAQELVNKEGQRDYSMPPSSTMESYMYISSFATLADKNIGPALAAAGFKATRIKTDVRGSQLITATYPSVEAYNKTMQDFDPKSFILEVATPSDVYNSLQVTRALAEGRLLTSGRPSHMLCNIAMLTLLAPEVLEMMQQKALLALDKSNNPVSVALESSPIDLMNSLRSRIGGISTIIFAKNFINAVTDPFDGQVTPTGLESLGYELANMVENDGIKPADYGLKLAQKTVARILTLSSAVK